MKIAGIVAEYNPFHNGHDWHIAETRRRTGCDYVIVCMDGHFTQRGEPTPWSKWARARMALACGADAVFELPVLFAVRTADAFARAGVAILGGLGADILSFGSEAADMALIRNLARLRDDEPEDISRRVREKLSAGLSHARARGEAVSEALCVPYEALNRPNLILAAEYVRAIAGQGLHMEPLAVERRGAYGDAALGEFASAAAIRAAIALGETDAALSAIPAAARQYAEPERLHAADDMLLYRLRAMRLDDVAALPDAGEGLEHRLYAACRQVGTREALLDAMKCKRYTHARLSRLLAHALLGIDRAMLEAHPMPTYARLLGVREGTDALLKELKARSTLPIVSRAAYLRGDPVFELECHATDVWGLLHDESAARAAGREFREMFLRVSRE